MDINFEKWLKRIYVKTNGEKVSDSTINKYSNAINTISEDMKKIKVIDTDINNMDLFNLDIAIEKILNETSFISKDNKGNRMYSCALKRYRCYRYFINDEEIENYEYNTDKITEKESRIKTRVGQQEFKSKLLNKYNERCIITNISLRPILIASHIKPWSVSTDSERIDVNNGLLLSATYDKLFDSGLITFKENGELLISKLIDRDDLEKLKIKNGTKFDIKLEGKMKEYLRYHNEVIFVR